MTAYGYDFANGNTPDVVEPFAVFKLLHNSHFEALDLTPDQPETQVIPPKKGGRPKKVRA